MRRMLLAGVAVALCGVLAVVAAASIGPAPRTAGSGGPGTPVVAPPDDRPATSGPFALAAQRERRQTSRPQVRRDGPRYGGRILERVTADLADRLDVDEERLRSALLRARDEVGDDLGPRRRWDARKREALILIGADIGRPAGEIEAAARNELEAKLRFGVTFGAISAAGRDAALACFDRPTRCDVRTLRREMHRRGRGAR